MARETPPASFQVSEPHSSPRACKVTVPKTLVGTGPRPEALSAQSRCTGKWGFLSWMTMWPASLPHKPSQSWRTQPRLSSTDGRSVGPWPYLVTSCLALQAILPHVCLVHISQSCGPYFRARQVELHPGRIQSQIYFESFENYSCN